MTRIDESGPRGRNRTTAEQQKEIKRPEPNTMSYGVGTYDRYWAQSDMHIPPSSGNYISPDWRAQIRGPIMRCGVQCSGPCIALEMAMTEPSDDVYRRSPCRKYGFMEIYLEYPSVIIPQNMGLERTYCILCSGGTRLGFACIYMRADSIIAL